MSALHGSKGSPGDAERAAALRSAGDIAVAAPPQITEAYKGYAGYQKRTDRDIPVVICEPRP